MTKSAKTYAFIAIFGLYLMLNSLSSIAHFINLPEVSGLCSTYFVTLRPNRVYGMCNRMCTKGFLNYFSAIIEFLKVVLRVTL